MNNEIAKIENQIAVHLGTAMNLQELKALHDFNTKLQKQPISKWVKQHQGMNYLPIRIVEQLLRTVFGAYQIDWACPPQIIGNSVVCSIHLKVYHPILKEWLSYAGVGAVPIQLKSSSHKDGARHALDFERINPMALHKNIPAAKSFAVNNAAKQLGNIFGATLNANEEEIVPIMDAYEKERTANQGLDNLVNEEA
jgi:hypothetical protein